MMGDPLLSVFPPPLLRLVLCGGGGLPVAYGPLHRYDGAMCVWEPLTGFALALDQRGRDPLLDLDGYRLPLDHWRLRLAVVAAWMLMPRHAYLCAHIEAGSKFLALTRVRFTEHERGMAIGDWTWDVGSGRTENAQIDLPTLPSHLLAHDPAVALLLALYDVPEIRAKVETTHG